MYKIQLKRIGYIVLAWTLVGLLLAIHDHLFLMSHLEDHPVNPHPFSELLIFNLFSGFAGGVMGGIVLTHINRKFRSRPYIYSLIWVVVFFVIIVSVITLITSIVKTIYTYPNFFGDLQANAFFLNEILTTFHLKNMLFWASVVAITHFSIQMSDKFGPGNLWRIITGKYHLPKEEERIFMFIDLKSSTTIAEQLGEEQYHEFLKAVFADVTDPIVDNKAEIYQYVGDEVVISWELEKLVKPEACLRCFFDIQAVLGMHKGYYLQKYGAFPEFKAGAHFGKVIAGEIGIIKRDITYSGDVLNTTARIQAQCNALESELLISGELATFIQPDPEKWRLQSKGFIPLKGKENALEVVAIDKL